MEQVARDDRRQLRARLDAGAIEPVARAALQLRECLDAVAEFVERAFAEVGITDWQKYVHQDPKFFRPAEVDTLLGDPARAKARLGWTPEITVQGARTLLHSIDTETVVGLRDRAIVAILIYTAARAGAVARPRRLRSTASITKDCGASPACRAVSAIE